MTDISDEKYEDDDGTEFQNICLSKDNKMKGSIIYFHTKEGKPFYVYRPLDLIHPHDIEQWSENTVDYYQHNSEFKYIYMKTIYWKLEILSCVLVCRNRQWFKDNIYELHSLWTIVEKERISGYEHRAPNRKQKRENIIDLTSNQSGSGCLLQFNKVTGKITVTKKEPEINIIIDCKDIKLDI